MEVVYHSCCGIDVHAKFLVACFIRDGEKQIQRFSTMTGDLIKLREWLVQEGCTHVAIESTGVYWKPVFNILERALKVILVNPEHVKALRGRKTDRKDCIRLAELLSVDLLQQSFIPPPQIRRLREFTRYRESLVRTHTAIANRIQKVMESGNIKLGQVAANVLGVSGRAMLQALAAGQTDPVVMAEFAQGSLKRKKAELELALRGEMNEAQRFVLGELLRRVKELEMADDKVNRQINQAIGKDPELFQAWELLQTITGVGHLVAEVVIAEIGVNLRETFPTPAHLASWAGVCPGNKASGGKRLSGKSRKGNRYLRSALVQAAWAATHTKQTFLSTMYHRLVRRLGKRKALIAVAHALTVIIYKVVDRKEPYKDLGADYYDRHYPEKQRKYLVKRLEALGYTVSLQQKSGVA
ncbi:MAG TPA: IS110 family transposase [Blastocatellia bacterium]|nr:IS110 family transposase [Blastocatellia bacterium]